jgi:hypothetical protein
LRRNNLARQFRAALSVLRRLSNGTRTKLQSYYAGRDFRRDHCGNVPIVPSMLLGESVFVETHDGPGAAARFDGEYIETIDGAMRSRGPQGCAGHS